tara:strand:- start:5204 stop:5545 length:342 start_codon:yes stop_codon:yes gene_type:complete
MKTIIFGRILFKGQGVEINTIIEHNQVIILEESKVDEYVNNYLANSDDSYLILEEKTKFNDKLILTSFVSIISHIKQCISELKDNGLMVSSAIDKYSRELDAACEASELIVID